MSGSPAAEFRQLPLVADVAHHRRQLPLPEEPRRPLVALHQPPHRLVHHQLREAERPPRHRRQPMRM